MSEQKWEYTATKLVPAIVSQATLQSHANAQAAQGWELVTSVQKDGDTFFIFKRPAKQ